MTLTANDFFANFGELLRCKRCKLSSSIFIQKILTKLHLNILTRSDRENTTCFHQLVQLCLTWRNHQDFNSNCRGSWRHFLDLVHAFSTLDSTPHHQLSSSTLPGVKDDRAEPWVWLLHLLLPENPPENKDTIRDGGCTALSLFYTV